MSKRSRPEADSPSRNPAHEQGGDSARGASGRVRAEALDRRPERQSGESDRGGPGLERDPYRDEGGEA